MPVDSIATVSTPFSTNQFASCSKSGVKVAKGLTVSPSRSGGIHAQISADPMSNPAALGWTILICSVRLLRFPIVSSSPLAMYSNPLPALKTRFLNGVEWPSPFAATDESSGKWEPCCRTGCHQAFASCAPHRNRVLLLEYSALSYLQCAAFHTSLKFLPWRKPS